jgi:HEAT repeat protein
MTSDILSHLLELLKDNSIQKSVVTVLKEIAPKSDIDVDKGLLEAIKKFIEALKHEQIQTRITAIEALATIKYPARIAIPALADVLLYDKDKSVQKKAKEALKKIILPPFSVSELIKKLKDENETDRRNAARELGEIGPPEAEKAIPDLIKVLSDEDEKVRYEAVRALRRINPEWRRHGCLAALIPCFIEAMGQADIEFRCKMPGEALEQIGEKAVQYLIESLTHPNNTVIENSADFLENCHPGWRESQGATDAVPRLIRKLQNGQWYIRCNAAVILGEIGWRARQSLPHLILASADRNRDVRDAARTSVSKMVLNRKKEALTETLLSDDSR